MALSAEEKERRRVERSARDRAYHARWKERQIQEDAGKREIERIMRPALKAASDAEEAMRQEMIDCLNGIDRQIAELKERKDASRADYLARIEPLHNARQEVWHRKMDAENALRKRLDAEFPDLSGPAMWSAAAWKPLNREETTDAQ